MTNGFICGNFDILHYGYFHLFQQCKKHCDTLIVGLHEDPSLEREHKHKPIHSVSQRLFMLNSIRFVDSVTTYTTELDLYKLLVMVGPHTRFLGTDYEHKPFTGDDLGNRVVFISRDHGYSTTMIKERLSAS